MDIIEAAVVVGAVLAAFCAVFFVARNETVWRRVVCPRTGKDAEVSLVRRYEEPRRPVRIRSCDLFEDPRKVDCEQECLKHCS